MSPVLDLRDVVAVVDNGFPVLAGLDLTVDASERLLVVGPNGAGKTSLLRTVAGLVPVVAGVATVLGHDLRTDRRRVRPHLGLLGHTTGLYDDLTPVENVAFGAAVAGIAPHGIDRALDRVALAARLRGRATGSLSVGQRRRVALASLLVRRPRIWLLDEPHAGFDARGRDLVDELVLDAAAAGATVVFASHDVDRSEAIASRIVHLAGGVIAVDESLEGSPGERG
ncbi:MAG: heme ABC exporter ATP-binding protein CcmA [Microthrixaceae bacterium]